MHITHLTLTNFRNYRHLDLDLPAGPVVIHGDNAQGKTNLLESIYLLATTRSHRASSDKDLMYRDACDEDMQVARLAAGAQRARNEVKVEIVLRAERTISLQAAGQTDAVIWSVRRQVRVNEVNRRSADLVGQINVVMFTAQDIELATGRSALCRRYLDAVNCQLDRDYLRSLQRYQKVLVQRNHLLRLLQEGRVGADQLDFWDEELVKSGSYIIMQRRCLVEALSGRAREIHRRISGGAEELRIAYAPNVAAEGSMSEIGAGFKEVLEKKRKREILQGMTLAGPHRDSLLFTVYGADVARFGSRGQQQTVVLSLKLAEAKHMQAEVNDHPIILLDDVFSELDPQRRKHLLALVSLYQQVLITATDLDCFDQSFLAGTARFRVNRGIIEPA
ncbi:MAG: DNA replication/repair protein RecF [Dehalococcoidia bacterium]|nr:DNA replication/repair protein RecF [Dehalococcoidia bacterium]